MKAPVLYGLFQKHPNGRNWVRLGVQAYPIDTARQVFHNNLIAGSREYGGVEQMLRPVGRGLVFVGLCIR